MNREDIRTEARSIFGETEASNSTISDATLNSWINEAYRYICTRLETLPITETTYTTSVTVTLNSNSLTVDLAKVKDTAGEWHSLAVIDLDELCNIDPDWENATTGEPTHMVRTGTFSARLYPPPNASFDAVSAGLKTYGMEFGTLDTDSSSPDLPLNMHDVIPHYVAYRAFARLQDANRSGNELMLVNGLLKSQKHITLKFSDKRGWRMMGNDEADGA